MFDYHRGCNKARVVQYTRSDTGRESWFTTRTDGEKPQEAR
jgi:hypothetical protein